MTYVKSIKSEGKKLLALLLTLAVVLSLLPMAAFAADPPSTAGTFENTSATGEDLISLSQERAFKAMIPIEQEIDPDDVIWSLLKDTAKPYTDQALYPNQSKGGLLDTWNAANGKPLFNNVTTKIETVEGQDYLVVTFENICYFWNQNKDGSYTVDYSVPHSNGGTYLDVCGYFNLTAALGGEEIGAVPVKIVPYDTYHTMDEVYMQLDEMVAFVKEQGAGLYVERLSMGDSSGELYAPLDMPYLIVADDKSSVDAWLAFTQLAQTDPTAALAAIEKGEYHDLRVPVMYSNIHANETAATDGIMEFAWMLLSAAAGDGKLSYDKLTGFTAAGKQQLAAEKAADKVAVPELIKDKATYLGYLKAGNTVSDKVDLAAYYDQETVTVGLDELLEDVFFVLVPEENVEGRTYGSRAASNGYDLNRDNSFQTTEETKNMQHLIGFYNPVSLTEFHGRVQTFQCEPCDPPHEPNFEYDLLAEHLMEGGEALGIAAVANNDTYNSYVIPQRDYLTDLGGGKTYWSDPWDDMSTSYTPQFSMLHGTVAYTVELPGYNDAAVALVQYGCLGQADYVATEKLGYLEAQTKIYERGVTNANSNELVGPWFCDQNDVEGAESALFRPVYSGVGENGNFYPECYIIPLDGGNQKNLQAAFDMMEWLSRNDVNILITKESFEYEGVTYPAGTMVVSMYQAKRSVANSALYDGTLIEDWTVLYSEGITSFAQTRGFDMVTVAKPAAYTAIKAACGDWMGYEDCKSYLKAQTSFFTGPANQYVVISNASEDAAAAVNELLQSGKSVGMVTDEGSDCYGDFLCTYASWLSVSSKYVLSGVGLARADLPQAKTITKAPVVYITGPSAPSGSGFLHAGRVSNANWNYDRVAAELMNFKTTDDPAKATLVLGASDLTGDALTAVQSGTPYIGYGGPGRGTPGGSTAGSIFGEALKRDTASGFDCLGYVTYPTTSLVNASYVMEGDDVMYGYGLGYFSKIPEGAQILVRMDGTKAPTEGFIKSTNEEEKASSAAFLGNSVSAIAFSGKDAQDNDVNVVLFANSLTHKGHQRDEYAYISNFAFSSLLGEAYCTGGDQCPIGGFVDVDTSKWYHDVLDKAVSQELVAGVGDGRLDPDGEMTRAMLVVMLYRMEGSPAVDGELPFADTKAGQWYSSAILWAVQSGMVNGYSSELFGTDDSVKREDLAVILYRMAKGKGASTLQTGDLASYADAGEIDGYAIDAVSWANGALIFTGFDSKLSPNAFASRAQAAAMLIRYLDLVL